MSARPALVSVACALVLAVAASCGDDQAEACEAGSLGCACDEGACQGTLECLSDVCVGALEGRDDAGAGRSDAGRVDAGGEADAAANDGGVDDDASGSASVPPTIGDVDVTSAGVEVSLAVMVTTGSADLERLEIAWGDGATETVAAAPPAIAVSHGYGRLGAFQIELTLVDAAGGQSVQVVDVELAIPRDALELELLFTQSTADTGPAMRDVAFTAPVYATDRFDRGDRAVDLYNEAGNHGLASVPFIEELTLSLSIAVWVQVDSLVNAQRIAGQDDWFNLFVRDEAGVGTVGFGVLDGFFSPEADPPVMQAPITDGVWTLLVGVVEQLGPDTRVALYVDGELAASETLSSTAYPNPGRGDAADACRFYVGNRPENPCSASTSHEFDGLSGTVDDVRVYSRALSAGEVRALFVDEGD